MEDLMKASVDQDCEIAAVVHDHEFARSGKVFKQGNCTIYRVKTWGALMFVPVSPGFLSMLRKAVEEFKPDVLHIHMPNLSPVAAFAIQQLKHIPWVVHWHSDVVGNESRWYVKALYPIYRLYEQAILKRAVNIIATSPPYLKSSKPLECWRDKCDVVSLGISPERIIETVSKRHSDEIQLLIIGRLTYYKGHSCLLKAMHLLQGMQGKSVHLNIVGTGEEEEALKAECQSLGLKAAITFHGRVATEQLSELLGQADIFVLPSIERTEAFGVVLMEAASLNIPAIVSDVDGSGMSWVVKNDRSGLVFPTGDEVALAKTIHRLANDDSLRLQLGKQAGQEFSSRFHIQSVATQIIDIYNRCLV